MCLYNQIHLPSGIKSTAVRAKEYYTVFTAVFPKASGCETQQANILNDDY